jgi:hypothetical protein
MKKIAQQQHSRTAIAAAIAVLMMGAMAQAGAQSAPVVVDDANAVIPSVMVTGVRMRWLMS